MQPIPATAPIFAHQIVDFGFTPAAGASRAGSLVVTSYSDQDAGLRYDGTGLTITAPEGTTIQAFSSSATTPHGPDLQNIGHSVLYSYCGTPAGPSNVAVCSVLAYPAYSEVSFVTLPSPPVSATYQDNNGAGTISITNEGLDPDDPSANGFILALTIVQNGVMLQGAGLAPLRERDDFLLAMTLSDTSGNAYLYEGTLLTSQGTWRGKGRLQSLQDPSQSDSWTIGTVPPPYPPGTPPVPPDFQLGVSPPSGSVGQALQFTASGPGADPSTGYQSYWLFGDGVTAGGTSAPHTYAAAGSYSVTLIEIDASGQWRVKTATVTISAA